MQTTLSRRHLLTRRRRTSLGRGRRLNKRRKLYRPPSVLSYLVLVRHHYLLAAAWRDERLRTTLAILRSTACGTDTSPIRQHLPLYKDEEPNLITT